MDNRWIWTFLPAAAVLAAALTERPAPAEQAVRGPGRVAVVDIVKVFNEYEQTKALNMAFEQRRGEIKTEAEKRREVIQDRRKTLEAYKPDQPDYKTIEKEAIHEEIDMQVWLRVQEQEIKNKHKYWLEQTYQKICAAAAKIATDKGFDIILTYEELNAAEIPDSNALKQQIVRRNVIYADAQVDVTDEVLQNLNLDYKSTGGVKISF